MTTKSKSKGKPAARQGADPSIHDGVKVDSRASPADPRDLQASPETQARLWDKFYGCHPCPTRVNEETGPEAAKNEIERVYGLKSGDAVGIFRAILNELVMARLWREKHG